MFNPGNKCDTSYIFYIESISYNCILYRTDCTKTFKQPQNGLYNIKFKVEI